MSNWYIGLIVLVGLVATVLLLSLIFSKSGKPRKVFEAVDGTKFFSERDCFEYEFLYKRLKCIYGDKKSMKLGLNETFIQQIKSDGFSNLNLLISNKNQFKKLVELLEVSEITSDSESDIK